MKLADWYYVHADRRVDVFAFADGRSLSWQELLAQKAVSLATEGGQLDGNEGVDDVLRGSTLAKAGGSETLRGLGGRDRLYAGLSSRLLVEPVLNRTFRYRHAILQDDLLLHAYASKQRDRKSVV